MKHRIWTAVYLWFGFPALTCAALTAITTLTAFAALAALPALGSTDFAYFNPTDTASIPKTISATGFYSNLARKIPASNALPFEINAALWSDGAWKQRWIILPRGKSIPYVDTSDFFDYPDSTVFVKNFWLERNEGDTTSRVLWETRLLIKHADASAAQHDWYGFSYRWDSAQTDAHLVSPDLDEYGLFFYSDNHGRRTYKKWRFPSTGCNICHLNGTGTAPTGTASPGTTLHARSVLGFYPAQLKRPLPSNPKENQVADLFRRGIFTGGLPDSTSLERRFHGIGDPIPSGLSSSERFAVIDTLARSYLAANCSGCHGFRGIANNAIGIARVNFDFFRFSPAIEFAHFPTQTFFLNDTTSFSATLSPYGRAAFVRAVVQAGLDTAAGHTWHMELPPHSGDPMQTIVPALLYPGYPAVSELLYRQSRRSAAWVDSANLRRNLPVNTAPGDTSSTSAFSWVYAAPWGSREWEDSLASHGWTIDSIFAATGQYSGHGHYFFYRAPEQMPELGTYVADTVALKILGEWVRNYQPATRIQPISRPTQEVPRLRGRALFLPRAWSGRLSMSNLQGRKYTLQAATNGTVLLPASAQAGVYFFRMGIHAFTLALY